jgi:hypothetical protein
MVTVFNLSAKLSTLALHDWSEFVGISRSDCSEAFR